MSFDLKTSQFKQPEIHSHDHDSGNFHKRYQQHVQEQHYSDNVGKVLHTWRAPEFEVYEKSKNWYLIGGLFIAAMVTYAVFYNSPIMAIVFVLIGIVGYIYAQKKPDVISFAITSKGLLANKEMYLYENIFSFWIFYEPEHSTKIISLHTKASMMPFVHVPLKDEDPVFIRELLLNSIPEIKQDPSLIDTIEKVLHI